MPGTETDAIPVGSVRQLLERQAHHHRDRVAVTLPDARLTYADVDELADRSAEVLLELGVVPGSVVAAMCGNGVAMLATWFGCAKTGAVFLPVNPLLRHEPLRSVLAQAQAVAIVVDAPLEPALEAVRPGLPSPPHVVRHDVFLDRVERAHGEAPALDGDPSSPAKLMYTSGTTGVPKGVLWNRACEAAHGTHYGDELVTVDAGEGVYCCLPLSHVTCQGTLLATLWRGGHLTLDAGFDAFAFWRRVREADAVMFTFVGTILSVLGRRRPHPDDADNPVRRILGAAAPADLWPSIEDRFGLAIVDVWGQTETASCWTMPASLPQEPGTVGRATDRFESMVVEPTGGPERTPVRPGTPGELWIRPTRPHVLFDGYLTDDGLDRSAFTDDGWYRTGDLMAETTDGDLRFAGRIREAIRRRGEMIAAGDIEAAARAHDAVAEAAAVGVPADDGVEEEIKLCVVAHDDTTIDPAALHRHLREALPRFMVPRYVDVRAELPKTPSTRVRRFVLTAEGAGGAWDARDPGRVPTPARPSPHNGDVS